MTPAAPAVSVVIPTRNRASFLPAAVRSARTQTLTAIEILVVDDGSTDETARVSAELAATEPRLRVLHQDHRGLAAARNAGVVAASAPWVAFLDDDDLWRSDAIACLLRFAEERVAGAVACLAVAFESASPDLGADDVLAAPDRYRVRNWPPQPPGELITIEDLVLRPLAPVNAGLFSRELVRRHGGFWERLRSAEDYHLWLRLAAEAAIPVLPRRLALVRRHQGQMTDTLGKMASETRVALEAVLGSQPSLRARVGRRRVARRRAALARDEAYAALLAGDRRAAARAAFVAASADPFMAKAWAYLALAPVPALYLALRRLTRR